MSETDTAQRPADDPESLSRIRECADRLHRELDDKLRSEELEGLADKERRMQVRQVVEYLLDGKPVELTDSERERVVEMLIDDVVGLGPIESLLRDRSISDILVNAPNEVYIERAGRLEEVDVRFRDEKHLLRVIDRIVAGAGRRIDDVTPMVDARLPNGSRVNAVIPPLAVKGPTISIRCFSETPLRLADLLELGTLSPEMAFLLRACVEARLNIIISGGTGSGKTTLLNVLSGAIPERERIVTIEDTTELQLQQRHLVSLEARPANLDGQREVTQQQLVRNALRMRPDRIIVGESRGAEALDMLQAMNTGHEGSMTTLHANSPRDGLTRLETMLMMGGLSNVPIRVLRRQIVSAIHVLVHIDRLPGGSRKVTEISEVVGMEGDIVTTQEIFVYRRIGVDDQGNARGHFETTGVRPIFAARLSAMGIDVPIEWFQGRVRFGE